MSQWGRFEKILDFPKINDQFLIDLVVQKILISDLIKLDFYNLHRT